MALLPLGVILLGLAGITLVGTMMGLALATPVFILFSPVIVPAVLTIGFSVMGFLTCGTFGLTGLTSLSFLVRCVRQTVGSVPEQVEHVKKGVEDVGVYTGQKTLEVGKMIMDMAENISQWAELPPFAARPSIDDVMIRTVTGLMKYNFDPKSEPVTGHLLMML
ncbi:oleosin 18.2 kDa [Artemisia annua]|uniref:Oleosin n=1 Tax=Artemisia annua TaxID=35608 RepID=A0A2U1NKV6_ARTAN|nr:oleosin 18.2 kDa [Artemisia annua]